MHPYLQFPQLFFLAPQFVPFLLRIVVALSVGYIAYVHSKRSAEIAQMRMPIIGARYVGLVWVAVIIEAALALMLLFGYYTQLAALVVAVLCIKHFIFAKKYARAVPLCRVDYVYLFVMCLCLILSGAGAFGMDVPL